MPYTRRRKSYPKKKTYRRKKGYTKKKSYKKKFDAPTTLTLRKPATIMPDRLKTKLVWTDTWQASGNTNGQSYSFSGNSVWDPYTGVGETACQGLDELAYFYTKYRVFASSIKCTLVTSDSSEVNEFYLYPSLTTTIYANPDENGEICYSKTAITGAAIS